MIDKAAGSLALSNQPTSAKGGAGTTLVLVFGIEGREYALAIADVVEVLRMVATTPLPEGPAWLVGLINFRGRVVPLIDLSSRLGAPPRPPDISTRIIVVLAEGAPVGLIVDYVVEVLGLPTGAVEATGKGTAIPAISGVARDGSRLILVLDRERLCDGCVGFEIPFDPEGIRAER